MEKKRIIYSCADNHFEIPQYNSAFYWFNNDRLQTSLDIINLADVLIVQNKTMQDYCIQKKHVDPKKIKIIENRISKLDWADKAIKRPYDFKSKPKILFTGSGSYCEDFKFLLPLIEKTHKNMNGILQDYFSNIWD